MKILFAVNSEDVSSGIIKKYQKDYREIISYKNVYYFDAIQKEIQQDKSYDRIVISEDLEPFSNSNYETMDKFIFEKLDGISDESNDLEENKNTIILICSDRHTKGSSFLVKLFGLGIYNALIGRDRSYEEVCRLIKRPRTKKEAKMYYQIDANEVGYKAIKEDEVSEVEIQNIIAHFKKLGKNYSKYDSSFEKIASQYNESQLKIIINCLPLKVKTVLEENSPKYQEVMAIDGKIVKGIKSSAGKIQSAERTTGIKVDIIENKIRENKITKPIVIPNTIRSSEEKKVVKVEKEVVEEQPKLQVQPDQGVKRKFSDLTPEEKRKFLIARKKKALKKKMLEEKLEEEKKITQTKIQNEKLDEISSMDEDMDQLSDLPTFPINENENKLKKKRGRPKKEPTEKVDKPKGKRGRPRKIIEEELKEDIIELDDSEEINDDIEAKSVSQENANIENNNPNNTKYDENMDLSSLDELDDINFDEDETTISETAFDEFDDYDEYGEYETTPNIEPKEDESKVENNLEEEIQENDLDDIEFEDIGDESVMMDDINESFDFDEDSITDNEEKITQENNEQETELKSIEPTINYSMSNLNSLLTKDKKIVTFVGTSKNGVSFLVNNLAKLFSSIGINTAILDMTKNKNSYYIYTNNQEDLRKIAYNSLTNLQKGVAEGIKVNSNMTVYTTRPNDGNDYSNAENILSTLVQSHSLILVDCDFETDSSYFANSQEIYLVQSMDVLTIQPLTTFLRELLHKGVLEQEKIKIVINKELKVRNLNSKKIIAGMSFYNDSTMSVLTELFNKDNVKYCSIPFEEAVYAKYLYELAECKFSINDYSKSFKSKLQILAGMVYPLTSKKTYSTGSNVSYDSTKFSNDTNEILNKMKKKY